MFFPIGTTGPTLEQIDEVKAVCRRCPVVEQCLDRGGQGSPLVGAPHAADVGAGAAAPRAACRPPPSGAGAGLC
ncbi:WhiB family transcriptional regulator [Streptomyces sp. DT203]|uniref:WhiB family transcriptional regulator n=1 Tax=Streptomyces sp. DT203 TaxID=3393424 RepID=UPI003CF2FB06